MAEVFKVDTVKVLVGDEVAWTGDELDTKTLLDIAREAGIREFTARLGGKTMTSDDFPITEGVVEVVPYAKAG